MRYTTGRGANADAIVVEPARHPVDELLASPGCDQGTRMEAAERLGDEELAAQESDAVDGELRHFRGPLGDGEVDVQLRRQRFHDGGEWAADQAEVVGRVGASTAPSNT